MMNTMCKVWVTIFWCVTLHAAEPQPVSQTQMRRQAIRAMLLPFLHNDVIPIVLGYAAKSWLECVRDGDFHWLTQPADAEKDQKKRAAAEQAWLQQLGYDYEDAEAIRSRIPALKSASVYWPLRRHGKIEGFVDADGRVYPPNVTQPILTIPSIFSASSGLERVRICNAVLSDCGKRMLVRDGYSHKEKPSVCSRIDGYRIDWDKQTLTKDGFSYTESGRRLIAVADKREAIFHQSFLVTAGTQELIKRDIYPFMASFMGNNLLVCWYATKLDFYDTSRSVPAGYNRCIKTLDIPYPDPDQGNENYVDDLSASYETGRIVLRMKNFENDEVTTKVLQLGE